MFVRKSQKHYKIPDGARAEHAVASATVEAVRMMEAPAIVTLTSSGITARLVSSYRPPAPIVAASHHLRTVQRLSLVWGVCPLQCDPEADNEDMIQRARQHIVHKGIGEPGQRIIVTAGLPPGRSRATNMLRIEEL